MIGLLKFYLQPSNFAAKFRRVSSRNHRKLRAGVRRLFDKAYYRVLFGVKIPHAPRLTRKIAALENQQGRGDVPVPTKIWDSEYRGGHWAFLQELDQMTRYSVIAGYIQALKPKGRLLDVGCGEGILLDRLGADNYSKFVGIDCAQAAIERALRKQHPRSIFIQADAEIYVPNEIFDTTIFNEVLYYFAEPLDVARRYRAWLSPGGLFITSLYAKSDRACAINRVLKKTYPSIDEVEITSHGQAWIINVFTPTSADKN
jgi:2-polyprenyl-3-methyl-5-hydroxy-6-metoxy-1,4-benzoquinol methylase